MKKIFRMALFILGFCCVVVTTCVLLPDPFDKAYQRAIVKQYDYYKGIEGNKIVFVGNSSLSFGFDLDTMEELTGEQCVVLGNHAEYGMSFLLEMSKVNLESGDIVVLEMLSNTIDQCGENLLLTGIGDRYEMYKFFIPEVRGEILAYYPSYINEVIMYNLNAGYSAAGSYSMDSYDERGNMIYERLECEIPEPYTEEVAKIYTYVSFTDDSYEAEYVEYVNEYIAYCNELGVKVYITIPCYYDKAVISTKEDMESFDNTLRRTFNAPVISKQSDYIFGREYIYNAIAHCNTEGAKYRTKLIYEDMVAAGVF